MKIYIFTSISRRVKKIGQTKGSTNIYVIVKLCKKYRRMVLAARWTEGRLAYIWRRLWRWRFKKRPYGCRGFNLLGTDIRRFLGN